MRCADLMGFGPVGTNGPVMYPEVDHMLLGEMYTRHVAAMTAEGLHAKSVIAAQLAWRDQRIAALTAELEAARRDAERYRVLREGSRICAASGGRGIGLPHYRLDEADKRALDAAVDYIADAARQQEKNS